MNSAVRIDTRGHVATVTLTRPEVRNAFNDAVIAQLSETFVQLGERADVRAIVLAAEGPAFCAGADLNWMRRMADYTRDENLADAAQLAFMLRTIYECPKPTIARVQGDVYAGGMGLVAVCDVAIAGQSAQFALSEVRLGLIPATIGPYVADAIGWRNARRYFLSAERLDAATAARVGLVHEVVADAELDARVAHVAAELAKGGPAALAAAKDLLAALRESHPFDEALLADTAHRIAHLRATPEAREGIAAFLDKRQPAWIGQEQAHV